MDKKAINRQIRGISNRGSLLLVVFLAVVLSIIFFLNHMYRVGGYGSVWQNAEFVFAFKFIGLYVVLYPSLFILYYKFLNRQNGLRLRDAFGKSQRSFGWILKWMLISVGISQFAGMFLEKLALIILPEKISLLGNPVLDSNNEGMGFLMNALSAILLAPIFEELLFRATLYRNNEPVGQMLAAFITGIAFGLWHMNIEQVFSASIVGVFLCLIFAKTRSIASVMFIHFVNNLLVVLKDYLKGQIGSILSASDKGFMLKAMFHKQPVFSALLALLFLFAVFLLIAAPILLIVQIVKKRKSPGLSKGDFPYPAWKKTLVFFSAPLTLIAFLAIIVFTFVLSVK